MASTNLSAAIKLFAASNSRCTSEKALSCQLLSVSLPTRKGVVASRVPNWRLQSNQCELMRQGEVAFADALRIGINRKSRLAGLSVWQHHAFDLAPFACDIIGRQNYQRLAALNNSALDLLMLGRPARSRENQRKRGDRFSRFGPTVHHAPVLVAAAVMK